MFNFKSNNVFSNYFDPPKWVHRWGSLSYSNKFGQAISNHSKAAYQAFNQLKSAYQTFEPSRLIVEAIVKKIRDEFDWKLAQAARQEAAQQAAYARQQAAYEEEILRAWDAIFDRYEVKFKYSSDGVRSKYEPYKAQPQTQSYSSHKVPVGPYKAQSNDIEVTRIVQNIFSAVNKSCPGLKNDSPKFRRECLKYCHPDRFQVDKQKFEKIGIFSEAMAKRISQVFTSEEAFSKNSRQF